MQAVEYFEVNKYTCYLLVKIVSDSSKTKKVLIKQKMTLIFILTILVICQPILGSGLGSELEFFVSVDGSDSWDGTSPDIPGETNIAGPWKTLSHALSEIRKQRPRPDPGPENQATINLLSGIHYQKSTLEFDNRESYLTIQAYDDEMPVTISGGQSLNNPIGGWTIDGQVRTGIFPLRH